MLFFPRRKKRFPRNQQEIDRWWRRNRARAEGLAGRLSDDVLPELTDRLEQLREEAAPLVESMAERVPRRRRRSRRQTGTRLLVGLAFAVIVAVAVYLIWQRRDTEPAYLVEEPDEPLATPGDPEPDGVPEPVPGPSGERAGTSGDADRQVDAVAHSDAPEPARETSVTGSSSPWGRVNRLLNREVSARHVEPARHEGARQEAGRQNALPSVNPRAPQSAPAARREQLPRTTIRPNLPR